MEILGSLTSQNDNEEIGCDGRRGGNLVFISVFLGNLSVVRASKMKMRSGHSLGISSKFGQSGNDGHTNSGYGGHSSLGKSENLTKRVAASIL